MPRVTFVVLLAAADVGLGAKATPAAPAGLMVKFTEPVTPVALASAAVSVLLPAA
jgi:hypothetical protein